MHIKSICERNYVYVGSGRTVIPNILGIVLVHGYHKIDPDLVLPSIRANIENSINSIANGTYNYLDIVRHSLEIFVRKFQYFVSNIEKMDMLMNIHFSTLATSIGRTLTRCGHCTKFMKLFTSRPMRLYCSTCDETYNLPPDGTIKKYMERICPLDQFELILFSTGTQEKGMSLIVCPYCYNYPPFEEIQHAMSCNTCPHPTCENSLITNTITKCPEYTNCHGILTLDPSGGPFWKLICNSCNIMVKFAYKAYKVKLSKSSCERCTARMFHIDFHINHNPLKDGTKLHDCLFCNTLLQGTCEVV